MGCSNSKGSDSNGRSKNVEKQPVNPEDIELKIHAVITGYQETNRQCYHGC